MNEIELRNYLKGDEYTMRYFRGVMSYDKLSIEHAEPGLYIINTDVSTGPGIHWVALFLGDTCEYFDSLGSPPLELKPFLENTGKTYIYSNKTIQGNSDVCGDYCILFSYFRCRGMSMDNFLDMFTDNLEYNDSVVQL